MPQNPEAREFYRKTNYDLHTLCSSLKSLIHESLEKDPSLLAVLDHLQRSLVTKNQRMAMARGFGNVANSGPSYLTTEENDQTDYLNARYENLSILNRSAYVILLDDSYIGKRTWDSNKAKAIESVPVAGFNSYAFVTFSGQFQCRTHPRILKEALSDLTPLEHPRAALQDAINLMKQKVDDLGPHPEIEVIVYSTRSSLGSLRDREACEDYIKEQLVALPFQPEQLSVEVNLCEI